MGLNKENKAVLYTTLAVFSGVAVYFIYKLVKGGKSNQIANSTNLSINETKGESTGVDEYVSGTAQPSSDYFPLAVGMRGTKVFVLQSALNKLGQKVNIDGSYGQETYKAVTNVNGWGIGSNTICGLSFKCGLDYDEWNKIIENAKTKGFNVNLAWTEAKKLWKL